MAQLMPLTLTVSCFSKIQIGFTFLVLAHPGSPGKRAIKRVCVCVFQEKENTEQLEKGFGLTTKLKLLMPARKHHPLDLTVS